MRALDAYRDLRRELDKHESPSFTIKDFNYFFNSAVDNWVAKNYAGFPMIQKEVDDIRAIIKTAPLTFTANEANLPNDYRHILNLTVVASFTVKTGRYNIGDQITLYPVREKSGSEGYNQNNAFLRPSHKSPWYSMLGSKIRVKLGSALNVVSASIEYIRIPSTVFLNPAVTDYTPEIDNTTIEFPNHVYYELVKECKRIFLENIESQRYQTTLNEEAQRK